MIGLYDRSCNRGQILPGWLLFCERPFTTAWIAAGAGLGEQNLRIEGLVFPPVSALDGGIRG